MMVAIGGRCAGVLTCVSLIEFAINGLTSGLLAWWFRTHTSTQHAGAQLQYALNECKREACLCIGSGTTGGVCRVWVGFRGG